MRLVIVGGSDAGTEAALCARRTDASLEITLLVADEYLNYSICGLPFYLSGEVGDWHALAHRDARQIAAQGIEVLLEHRAETIDPIRQLVSVRREQGTRELAYDRLILATGARPVLPAILGLEEDGVFLLHTMGQGIELRAWLEGRAPSRALVVGSGYIGVEMADALTRRRIAVTLAGRAASVLPSVDPSLGALLAAELERHGVVVLTSAALEGIARVEGRLQATLTGGQHLSADLVVVGAGVRPDTELARSADLKTGTTGALKVTRRMQTSVPRIYAAGDCVETWHALLQRPTYLPLGTTSHKQGRVAGENAAGGRAAFGGSLGTQVVKVFDLAVARTGLRDAEARAAGYAPLTIETSVPDHKPYYPGASELRIRLTGDAISGRLLGAQIVGDWRAEVAKRIDIVAAALYAHMTVEDLTRLDLSYTPPVSAPWDPVQAAADTWDQARLVGGGVAATWRLAERERALPDE
ncbi:MAG: FAD-dependent oxidoreductase [Candidatus Limnocylindrales bacterium]